MRLRLFLRIVCLGLPFAVWFCFVALGGDPHMYVRAVRDKHRKLAAPGQSRLILVGGSNIAFSVDSAELERQSGRRTINMGISIFLGLRYMLAEVIPHLRPDDFVVIVPEHEQFYGNYLDGWSDLWRMIVVNPDEFEYLDARQKLEFIKEFPAIVLENASLRLNSGITALFHRGPGPKPSIYTAAGFESHGDFVGHLGLTDPDESKMSPSFVLKQERFNPDSIAVLKEFNRVAVSRGAHVCLVWPGVLDSVYRTRSAELLWLHGELSARLDFPLCGTPAESMLPRRFFFDSYYHTNAEGRDLRTRQMLRQLRDCSPAFQLTGVASRNGM